MPLLSQDQELRELDASYKNIQQNILTTVLSHLAPTPDHDDSDASSNYSSSAKSPAQSDDSGSINSEELLTHTAESALKNLETAYIFLRDEVRNREPPEPAPKLSQLEYLYWSRKNRAR